MADTEIDQLEQIFRAEDRAVQAVRAKRQGNHPGQAIYDPPHPSKDPALDPKVRSNLVRLGNAYKRGGREAMEKVYNELHPEAIPASSSPGSSSLKTKPRSTTPA